jgi:hypothetical protein
VQETWIVAFHNPLHAHVRLIAAAGLFGLVAMLGCEEPLDVPRRRLMVGDGGAAVVGLAIDGEACMTNEECESGHCDDAICCADGDCCRRPDDCPASDDGMMAVCDDPANCQGRRGAVSCSKKFKCEPRDDFEDDSACTEEVEAISCDPFLPVHCTGDEEQDAPECPDECEDDNDCLEEANCYDGVCMPDSAAAAPCDDNADCVTGYCNGGICCESGTCCTDVIDCGAPEFNSAATCDEMPSCQGFRGVPACENNQCTTKRVNDDSACNGTIVANACGDGEDVRCSGERDQRPNPQPCASGTCSQNYECARTSYCQARTCTPDLPNGDSCSSPDMCQSGHCEEDVCCSYDCCAVENRCPGAPACAEDMKC